MISKQTAMDIALSYREVENAEALLMQITEAMERREPPDVRDAFGRSQDGLKLGVPSGESRHQLFNVPWSLAKPIIKAHISHHKTRIALLTEHVRIQFDGVRS